MVRLQNQDDQRVISLLEQLASCEEFLDSLYKSMSTAVHAALKKFDPYLSSPGAWPLPMSRRAVRISSKVIGTTRFCCCNYVRIGPAVLLLPSSEQLTVVPPNLSKCVRNSSTTSLRLVGCSLEALVITIMFHLLFCLTRSWKTCCSDHFVSGMHILLSADRMIFLPPQDGFLSP